jgi:hypothetical protein
METSSFPTVIRIDQTQKTTPSSRLLCIWGANVGVFPCDPTGWLSELCDHRAAIQYSIDEIEHLLAPPANDNDADQLRAA